MSYDDFMKDNKDTFKSESMDSMANANILFSSGTTGEPKAIPWHHSTFTKPICDGYLHNDVRSNEVVAWPTNVGWMMGPWLIAQMGLGSTIALFVGSPLSKAFCYFVEQSKIAHLGVIPSLVKAWMKTGATDDVDWSGVRRFRFVCLFFLLFCCFVLLSNVTKRVFCVLIILAQKNYFVLVLVSCFVSFVIVIARLIMWFSF